MRIIIDMQGAQGISLHRGIGRYTLSLAKSIIRNRGNHEVFLVLNGVYAESIAKIRDVFDSLLPQENIKIWHVATPVRSVDEHNAWRRGCGELVREAFIAGLKPDFLLVSSLFEGLSEDSVTSIGKFCNIPTAVILYDLIPLIQRHVYLENPVIEKWYEEKLGHLRRANLLLGISESSTREGIRYLGFPEHLCRNISTAADEHFKPITVASSQAHTIRGKFGLSKPFMMYTGGIDHRKNIEGLIRAYAQLPVEMRAAHQLAIVCSIQQRNRDALEQLGREQGLKTGELVLTGFVSEEDLLALYNLCKAFVFPSWHEGFGLPALEAMSCGKAVIAANTSSLPEVVGNDEALFDPLDQKSITAKLAQVLGDERFRQQLEIHGIEQARKFSWDHSGRLAVSAMEQNLAIHSAVLTIPTTPTYRPRLAFVSPLPPERSGISDYSAELLPELARFYDIDVISAQEKISDAWILANCAVRTVEWFREHGNRYDRVLYHFGNSHFHQHMFALQEEVPGVVVLHDFFLSGIVRHMDVTGYAPGYWARCLLESHGYKALAMLFKHEDPTDVIWSYPCNFNVLNNALGVIVHSENSLRLATQWYGPGTADDWDVVPLLRIPALKSDRKALRQSLDLKEDDFLLCTFGMIASTKLNHRLLNAFIASTLAKDPRCILVFVGEQNDSYGSDLLKVIRRSGLAERIRITGWADMDTFRAYLGAADLGVQLRTRSRGETSAAVLDCMNYGLPTIVNANGSMADLHDDGVWKLADDFLDADLTSAMETLFTDRELGRRIGERAREIVAQKHAPRICAAQYADIIEMKYNGENFLAEGLIKALAGVDPMTEDASSWAAVAAAVSSSLPPRLSRPKTLIDISELLEEAENKQPPTFLAILENLITQTALNVEPIYFDGKSGFRFARQYTCALLKGADFYVEDEVVEIHPADRYIRLGWKTGFDSEQFSFYQRLRESGMETSCFLDAPNIIDLDNDSSHVSKTNNHLAMLGDFDRLICASAEMVGLVEAQLLAHAVKRRVSARVVGLKSIFELSEFLMRSYT